MSRRNKGQEMMLRNLEALRSSLTSDGRKRSLALWVRNRRHLFGAAVGFTWMVASVKLEDRRELRLEKRKRKALAHSRPRFMVGRRGPFPVWAPPESHVLCLAPPGSGKSLSLVVPETLSWQGPVVSASSKDDVFSICWRARAKLGPVYLLDLRAKAYECPEGVIPAYYSPLFGCTDWETARQTAKALTTAQKSPGGDQFWTSRAYTLGSALLYGFAVAQRPMSEVVEASRTQDLSFVRAVLQNAEHGAEALSQLDEIDRAAPTTKASVYQSWGACLEPFAGAVLRAADIGTFDPLSLLDTSAGAPTLFIVSPSDAQTSASAIVCAVLTAIYEGMRHETTLNGGTPKVRVAFVLDEVARIAALETLPSQCGEGRGLGLSLCLVSQSFSDLERRWGDGAKSIRDGCRVHLVFGGLMDRVLLDNLSALSGTRHQRERGPGPARYREVPRFSASDIYHLRPRSVLVFGRGKPAHRLQSAFYRKVEMLRRMTATPEQRTRRGRLVGLCVALLAVLAVLVFTLHTMR
jgi:type IV secretion system protein VirD4